MRAVGECVIEGCARVEVLRRGWCCKHYQRWLHHGDPEFSKYRERGLSPTPTSCSHCGQDFISRPRSDGRMTRFCSKSCRTRAEIAAGRSNIGIVSLRESLTEDELNEQRRTNWQRANRRRRARLLAVESESYTTPQIAERDGYRCALCRRKVDMAKRRPHPRSASIDHIVPLSLGGDDTRANVQLTHLECNLKKSNRVLSAQPLLIG